MSISSALGLAVLIIVLKFLVPAVLSQAVATTISFLHGAEISANVATGYAASAASLNTPAEPPFPLPQARY